MADQSNIQWTDATWNPVSGCTRASAGCDNCYAVKMTKRLEAMGQAKYTGLVNDGKNHFNGVVRCDENALAIPLGWKKPRRVFVNSMSDLFHPDVPFDFIDKVFAVMALCPQHTFQVLTKRPERMAEYLTSDDRSDAVDEVIAFRSMAWDGGSAAASLGGQWEPPQIGDEGRVEIAGYFAGIKLPWPLPNLWLGTSCEDQATADERIPHLLRCPAAVRFISAEPLLGPMDLTAGDGGKIAPFRGLDWVIVGGESGHNARPCDVAWIRSIVRQCQAAGAPVFVKQLGADPIARIDCQHCNGVDSETCGGCDGDGKKTVELPGIRDRKGGTMEEWPQDLRAREFPAAARQEVAI